MMGCDCFVSVADWFVADAAESFWFCRLSQCCCNRKMHLSVWSDNIDAIMTKGTWACFVAIGDWLVDPIRPQISCCLWNEWGRQHAAHMTCSSHQTSHILECPSLFVVPLGAQMEPAASLVSTDQRLQVWFLCWSLQGVQLMLPLQTSTDHHLTVLLDLTSWMKHNWVAPKNPDNRWQQASIVARTVQPMPRKLAEKGRGEIKSWVEAIWQAKKNHQHIGCMEIVVMMLLTRHLFYLALFGMKQTKDASSRGQKRRHESRWGSSGEDWIISFSLCFFFFLKSLSCPYGRNKKVVLVSSPEGIFLEALRTPHSFIDTICSCC